MGRDTRVPQFLKGPRMPEHTESFYAASIKGGRGRPQLQGDHVADVCVIGGGFTGVSSALHLAERGYNVILLEGARIGWGASGRNGGQLYNTQRKPQAELESRFGKQTAHRLWDLSQEAVEMVVHRVRRHQIPCDLKPGILVVAAKRNHVEELKADIDKLHEDYGYNKTRFVGRDETAYLTGTDRFHAGELNQGCYHLHPLNLALGMAAAAEQAGAKLFEQSPVQRYTQSDPSIVTTPQGTVKARFVVLACNGYLGNLEPQIAGKAMPINNFVLATEPFNDIRAKRLNPRDLAFADTKFVVNYWRLSADRRLVFGGGETYSSRFPADIKAFVRRFMLKVYPQLEDVRIDYAWGGTLAVTLKRLPHFGRLAPNVIFAQGFSGQGVALANLAGKLIAETISGIAERFDVMANLPTPSFPGGTLLRHPALVLGMLYYALRDRL